MRPRHDRRSERRTGRGAIPAEVPARAFDAGTPPREQVGIDADTDSLEHRARAAEEQVAAHQPTRVVERQWVRRVQFSVSGASHTPRSSRIRPGISAPPSPASCEATGSGVSAACGEGHAIAPAHVLEAFARISRAVAGIPHDFSRGRRAGPE